MPGYRKCGFCDYEPSKRHGLREPDDIDTNSDSPMIMGSINDWAAVHRERGKEAPALKSASEYTRGLLLSMRNERLEAKRELDNKTKKDRDVIRNKA